MLTRPICTYGSEIWINDFTLKDSCIDKLPFEKIHNKFGKNILGVHKKSSNFAAKCELGRPPVLNFITILALKYFNRLKPLPSDRLLGEVYEEDKSLFIDGHRSWQKFIHNSLQNLNSTSLDFDINKINQLLTDQHSKVILKNYNIYLFKNMIINYFSLQILYLSKRFYFTSQIIFH